MPSPPRRRSLPASTPSRRSSSSRRRAFVSVERIWGGLADLFNRRDDHAASTTLVLAPCRLEPRRMLDAAAPALALETLAVSAAFVPASEEASTFDADAAPTGANTPPTGIDVQTPIVLDENGVATLSLSFVDPDALDPHTVEINWQDGTVESFTLPPGETTFSTTHQYLDDNLSGPATEDYDVAIRVTDAAGDFDEVASKITVLNVAPSNLTLATSTPTSESGLATLYLSFDDPGTLDQHTVEIDWGDGSAPEVLTVPVGDRTFAAMHEYLDDNPTGTSADDYQVTVRVVDDDLGEAMASTTITVANVAPSNIQINPIAPINENGVATLNLTFDDPGTLDSHTVEVDWGDGSAIEKVAVPAGARTFSATHQYLDDSRASTSSDVYSINVTVRDDDGGVAAQTAAVTVKNVAPSNLVLAVINPVNENGVATLNLSFDDPGTLDNHRVEINWGDGTAIEFLNIPAGAHAFTATHQYLDDNPTGTIFDNYPVSVKLIDDDGGVATASRSVVVANVSPQIVQLTPAISTINEGSAVVLNVEFNDPGTLDTHAYEVDWGDGHVTSGGIAGQAFSASHVYADDGVYAVKVKVIDDDNGVAAGAASVTVNNVAPSLTVVGQQTVNEGSTLSLPNIGAFTDPGFDNPANAGNASNGGEAAETFIYSIDWGDGSSVSAGAATVDAAGGVGAPTSGSFDGQHTYADNGVYTVTVTVFDDDGGSQSKTFQVDVKNVAPALTVVGPQTINEGSLLDLDDVGSFTDPGFNNSLNPLPGGETEETFTYSVDWGDGTVAEGGAAMIDGLGSVGTPTSGSFNGSHVYADNGTYTVKVTVTDDDGDATTLEFQVTVLNVDPTLTFTNPSPTVNEGSAFTLAGLGIGIEDPGFDNAANPNGPSEENVTGYTVDWGDGAGAVPLATTPESPGGVGIATKAGFAHVPHTYADNGVYTVTLRVSDDDGGVVERSFTITVDNVAPTLLLTDRVLEINEGDTLDLIDLGTFTDPGFDNLLNGGETEETFTYTIDWDDGTIEEDVPTASRTNGSAETPTRGTLSRSHEYLDNDADNFYTIKVTLTDDDGGSVTQSIQVRVNNVNPKLQPIAATDVTTQGATTLTLTFTDPGKDSYRIMVNWGDNNPNADADGFVEAGFVEANDHDKSTPVTRSITYNYDGPPDPDNPSAKITITVKILDDDFGTPGIVASGESNPDDVQIANPGIGTEKFRIDTTPQVALLTFPDRQVVPLLVGAVEARTASATSADEGGGGGDSRATSERYLELRVINPDGTLGEGHRLPAKVLNNLPALFRNLPDNHYAIYLVQSETNARRLVIDVFVRNGKLIDPGDDSEGARDRPPTDEANARPVEAAPEAAPVGEESLPIDPAVNEKAVEAGAANPATEKVAPLAEPGAAVEFPGRWRSSTAIAHSAALAGVALALSGAGRDWHRQLEQTLTRAKPDQWKRLRTAGHRQPKKPR